MKKTIGWQIFMVSAYLLSGLGMWNVEARFRDGSRIWIPGWLSYILGRKRPEFYIHYS